MKNCFVAILFLIFSTVYISLGQCSVSGKVYLHDSVLTQARYITVFIQETKTATMTDENGCYKFNIDSSADTLTIEYSYIGYKTETRKIISSGNDYVVDSVILELQPYMLAAAYILPKGMTPAEYILSMVWKKAKENKKKLKDYGAKVDYCLSSHEIPIVSKVMPKGMMFIGTTYAKFSGFGPIVKLCLNNDDVDIDATLNRHVVGGVTVDADNRIVKTNVTLDKKTEENFKSVFSHFDLFEMLYGYETSWIRRFTKHHTFELIGTYEYNDKLVDILQWKSGGRLSATAHIVEDDWGILKIQVNFGPEAARCEARDVGYGGIYMPVNLVVSPNVTLIPAEKIPRAIEIVKQMKSINNKVKKRAVDLLESRRGQDFNPYLTVGFNIKYTISD